MKRLALLVVLVLLAAAQVGWAQQSGQSQEQEQPKQEAKPKPKPMDPADVETLTGRPYPGVMEPAPKPGHPLNGVPAPKKGHPLDWRDVDILIGKAERAEREARRPNAGYAPYAYGGVGYGYGMGYGRRRYSALASEESQFAPVTTETAPFFSPRFGRGHGGSFFFLRGTRSPFFFGHGGWRHSTLTLIP